MFIIWSKVYCALVIRFLPTRRIVHQIYRKRTIGVLRTNEKALTSWSNKLWDKNNQTKPVLNTIKIQNGLLDIGD